MRRIRNAAYDEDDYDDYYDDFDEYDDYEEAEEYGSHANGGLSQKQSPSVPALPGSSRAPALAPSLPVPMTKKKQSKKEKKSKGKSNKSCGPETAKADVEDTVAKVIRISDAVSGVGTAQIREVLSECGNDEAKTIELLLSRVELRKAGTSPVTVSPVLSLAKSTPGLSTESNEMAVSQVTKPCVSDKQSWKSSADVSPVSRSATGLLVTTQAEKRRLNTIKPSLSPEEYSEVSKEKPTINIVVIGHVDAGKSTLFGHLLYKLKYISQREMHKLTNESRNIGKGSFAFAWVMDTQESERKLGVTVDVGVKYFETTNRFVTLLDAPGHRDFIPNMITGTCQGDAAVLVVPGNPGEFERSFSINGQTKEHAILARYCGIRRLVVAINKMDVCKWSQLRFEEVKDEISAFLSRVGGYALENLMFVPVSGLRGGNLVESPSCEESSWYEGPTLLAAIDSLPASKRPIDKPLRMVVADIFKTVDLGQLTVSGKIESGVLREGKTVLVFPGKHEVKIKSIRQHKGDEIVSRKFVPAGETVDVGLSGIEESVLSTSSIVCSADSPIPVVHCFTAEVSTLAGLKVPLLNGTQVDLHVQNFAVPATITKLISLEQGSGLPKKTNPRFIRKNQTGTVRINVGKPIYLERYEDFRPLSRVLLRQHGVSIAAGRCLEVGESEVC